MTYKKKLPILLFLFLFTANLYPFTEKEVIYYSCKDFKLKAVLYLPDSGKNSPAIILLHEGGFRYGNMHCFNEWKGWFTGRGFAVMSVGYRLVQQGGKYPNALKDAVQALRWLKGNAKKLHINKSNISLLGSSAGAYLATMTALASGLPKEITMGHGEYLNENLSVKSVISSFGLYSWKKSRWKGEGFIRKEEWKESSPMSYTKFSTAPFLLLAGENDRLFGYKQAEDFATALKKNGVKAKVIIKPDQSHGGLCNSRGVLAKWAASLIDKFLQTQ